MHTFSFLDICLSNRIPLSIYESREKEYQRCCQFLSCSTAPYPGNIRQGIGLKGRDWEAGVIVRLGNTDFKETIDYTVRWPVGSMPLELRR